MYNMFLKLSESNLKGNTMQEKGKGAKKQQLFESAHNQEKPGTLQWNGPKQILTEIKTKLETCDID